MENGPDRASFWMEFAEARCQFPAPALLRDQIAQATFTEFCQCGCNSFGVRVATNPELRPLVKPRDEVLPGRRGAIFEADFYLDDGKTLELIIFANDEGNLDYIEVNCCSNSFPVPEEISASEHPFHTRASESLNSDM